MWTNAAATSITVMRNRHAATPTVDFRAPAMTAIGETVLNVMVG